jgi:hypothetical protein
MRGLCIWIDAAIAGDAHAEIEDLVRQVGIDIAGRRLKMLYPALQFANWLFRSGPSHLRELIVRDCDSGLTALLTETAYQRTGQPFNVPEIRAACVRLAAAMTAAGFAREQGASAWLSAAVNDPLPEVRYAR